MLCQMNSRVSVKYYLIPLLYIGLIGGLLYLQFAREEPFHLRFGALQVNGHVIAGKTHPPLLGDIELSMDGLSFSFSRSTPVSVELKNGSSQTVAVRSYSTIPEGIVLSFSSGLSLRFAVTGEGHDSLSIIPSMPHGVQVSSVSFSYAVAKGDKTASRLGIPALAVTRETVDGLQTHVLSLPFNSEIRPAQELLVLTTTGGEFGPATYAPTSKPNLDPVVYWFEQNGTLPDAAVFEKQVKGYLEKAWHGWTSSRFDSKTGTWKMRDGSPAFKQSIVSATLAEALARDTFGRWLGVMGSAASRHASDITLETTPYFGNLEATYAAYRPIFSKRLQDAQHLLAQNGESALSIPHLLALVADHGSESMLETVLAKMQSAKIETLSLSTVLSILGDDLAAADLGYSKQRFSGTTINLIDHRMLPSIIRTKNGYFIQSEPGTVDVASSIYGGSLLIRASKLTGDPILESIGRQLIISSIALSDNEGFLPGRLMISGDSVSGTEGFLAPEKIFPWVAPSAYYPREIPLTAQIGHGVWAWAASRILSVDSTKNETAITFDFPVGDIEHIVLHGIKPFRGIHLYGIPWRTDPNFERYSAGWVYDAADETLFIKLEHRQQKETVDIIY